MSKLNLDQSIINKARQSASHIAKEIQSFIDVHTTVAVERTIARLMGID